MFKSKYTQVLELLREFSVIFHGTINNHGSVINQLIEENNELKERISKLEELLDES